MDGRRGLNHGVTAFGHGREGTSRPTRPFKGRARPRDEETRFFCCSRRVGQRLRVASSKSQTLLHTVLTLEPQEASAVRVHLLHIPRHLSIKTIHSLSGFLRTCFCGLVAHVQSLDLKTFPTALGAMLNSCNVRHDRLAVGLLLLQSRRLS
jgi:hypothetical protein